MFASTDSMGLFGMNAFPVTVEGEFLKGHPQFDLTGLPDIGIRESRERVRSAAASLGLQFPKGRVLINLAPADVKKYGSSYDLAIFIVLMQVMSILPPKMPGRMFIGELGLNGTLRSVRGVMPMAMLARKNGFKEIYVPKENVKEAAVIEDVAVYGVSNVEELMLHLLEKQPMTREPCYEPEPELCFSELLDFSDVRGQMRARDGMQIAAAGGHNILLVGSPGCGKSMLANRMPTILPRMTKEEILETSNIYSAAGKLPPDSLITQRPFRAPHHTISAAGLTGGGSIPSPGEISLAHNGVLFLDELPEFARSALEGLRQPLEARKIIISRAAGSAEYPCSFMLVAAMNPCPCGYHGSLIKKCTCTEQQIQKYRNKISGPLMDRFDMTLEVDAIPFDELCSTEKPESSAQIRERVEAARERQARRFREMNFYCNAMIPDSMLEKFCVFSPDARKYFGMAYQKYHMSARTGVRVMKVARTLADLHEHDLIQTEDITMSVTYRGFKNKFLNPG